MINLKSISKAYDKEIVKDFSYSFQPGKSYVIAGESGSGKSTLLNIIGMLETIDKGEVYIDGVKNPKINSKEGQLILKDKISYMFQNYGLIDNETVLENLKLVRGPKNDLITISNTLKQVGLANMEMKMVATLSGGEQQRVAIAKILLKNAKYILADEPTGNLDEDTANTIMNLLQKIIKDDENKTLVVVTHNKKYLSLFDEVIYL